MRFRMSIGEGDIRRPVMIASRLIDEAAGRGRVEKSRIIDAIGILFDIDPGHRGIRDLLEAPNVAIDGSPWTRFCVALTDGEVYGVTARS